MKTKNIAIILAAAVGILLDASVRAAENSALMEPVKSVLDHYLMIQTELAKDSIKGLDERANAIAKDSLEDERDDHDAPADEDRRGIKVGDRRTFLEIHPRSHPEGVNRKR